MMKNCGDCVLCCKLLRVPTLEKPVGVWCKHFKKNQGCLIYNERPTECRNFNCLWLQSNAMDEGLKPSRCGIVFDLNREDRIVVAMVNPFKSNAWKSGKPKLLIQQILRDGYIVWVSVGNQKNLLLPPNCGLDEAKRRTSDALRRLDNGGPELHD